jgi:electron transport complex protein RnfG
VRESVKVVVVLTAVSLIAGGALAYTYQTTQPKIAENAAKARREAIAELLPGTASYKTLTIAGREVYEARDASGKVAGLAFVAESAGFNGFVQVMAGLDPQTGRLTGAKVLSQSETPGLGARIAEPVFTKQFAGKSIADRFEAKADVQAVTGATISTRAVAKGLKETAEAVSAGYGKEGAAR